MKLISGNVYMVKESHKFHPGRIGRFQFLGGPNQDVIVLSTTDNNDQSCDMMFAVGLYDLDDFNPDSDSITVCLQDMFKSQEHPEPPYKIVNIEANAHGGLNCMDSKCPFRSTCAQHCTGGDYRYDDGFSPELKVALVDGETQFSCATKLRSYATDTTGQYPDNYDRLSRGALSFAAGKIIPFKCDE